jgi:transcriptional regulator with XRE-family HTH domain
MLYLHLLHIATHVLPPTGKEANMFLLVEKRNIGVYMTNSLLQQLKKRRLKLGLKQNDMLMRIGVSRQQYQRLESKGNPRLDTLELIATGLSSKLMLIPKEKALEVIAVLERTETNLLSEQEIATQAMDSKKKNLSDDPWQDILGEDR